MAALFCQSCHINWPVSETTQCRQCGGETQPYVWRTPDKVLPDIDPEIDAEYMQVLAWRTAGFVEQGVDPDTSYVLATSRQPLGGFEVDLGRFRALRKRGWTAEQVLAVLG